MKIGKYTIFKKELGFALFMFGLTLGIGIMVLISRGPASSYSKAIGTLKYHGDIDINHYTESDETWLFYYDKDLTTCEEEAGCLEKLEKQFKVVYIKNYSLEEEGK